MLSDKTLWVAVLLTFGLVIANTAWLASQSNRINAVSQRNTAALCALRADIGKRRDASLNYLTKHPNGAPALGLSRESILKGIKDETSTLVALRPIACPLPKEGK